MKSDTLLTYAVSTDPVPLQVSAKPDTPTLATLTIVVSNDTHHLIDCKSLSFSFLEGKNAKDFFEDATGITSTTPSTGWSIKQNGALFTATPDTSSDGKIGPDSLVFIISGIKVNTEPGTTDMTVTEVAAVVANPPAPASSRATTLELSKFPLHFEVDPLKAYPPIVAQGGSVLLSWRGSAGATYELEYVDAHDNKVTIKQTKDGRPLPSTGSYTIENLQKLTIFYLVVTLTVPGQDKPLTIEQSCTVTVTLSKPQIDLFQGTLNYSPAVITLTLNWDASNTDYCTLTDDPHILSPCSTDDSYEIKLKHDVGQNKTYTLTAKNEADSATSEIVVHSTESKLLNSVKGSYFNRIALSPDNKRLYVIYTSDTVLSVYDASTLQHIESHRADDLELPSGVAVSPDGRHIYVTLYDSLNVLDAHTLKVTATVTLREFVKGVAVSQDGTRLYVPVNLVESQSTYLYVLDAQTLKITGQRALAKGYTQGIAISPDDSCFYVLMGTEVLIFNPSTLAPVGEPLGNHLSWDPCAFTVSPDNTRLYVASTLGPSLWGFSPHYLRLVEAGIPIDPKGYANPNQKILGLAVAPDNSCIYMSNADVLGKYSIDFLTGGKEGALRDCPSATRT